MEIWTKDLYGSSYQFTPRVDKLKKIPSMMSTMELNKQKKYICICLHWKQLCWASLKNTGFCCLQRGPHAAESPHAAEGPSCCRGAHLLQRGPHAALWLVMWFINSWIQVAIFYHRTMPGKAYCTHPRQRPEKKVDRNNHLHAPEYCTYFKWQIRNTCLVMEKSLLFDLIKAFE